MEQSSLMILPYQAGRLKSGKTKSSNFNVRGQSRTADCTEV
ncbi:unnamed protein product [Schistosoma margrebowiei]|uniref:Uncharacterized protein n=1 Tax=Schistosoma margrebowiei TaxID=48269 RepID=A0A3P8ETV8_9TREM|nr:unnamed protein product [Schistosoma margrebowiei]